MYQYQICQCKNRNGYIRGQFDECDSCVDCGRIIKNNFISEGIRMSKELVLVSCSGGFDSSMTLAILQKAGYKNIIACHFKYGHRGQDAEAFLEEKYCD